ncbi:uncharacterized protein BP01DRAFT_359870 [Aspergillus saccharolyticus JOP 1030-1]|uniref:Uncharacterized protein n=1 Tax=Aspergillus saccharolyticus JOP 1030-1 TaxID=1450539 RepID=A0A318ZP56_9EURO|nr:hypothetical protein BP01DRAFT_359870 [Aspergillus saccharolyticus JOP 1030-1]PYH41898.1 hypothetical protein BP01DRAFT_359870 [Aspergillus saccharolyticus JOP 1030-1]
MCRVIFICTELIQGNYKSAGVHLRRGFQLVGQSDEYWRHHPRQGSVPTAQRRHGPTIEAAIVQISMVLDSQLAQFVQPDPLVHGQSSD